MKRAMCAVLIAFALASSVTASADSKADADALFREGQSAAEHEQWQEACNKFAESQQLDPATGTLLNLANCQEKLGHLGRARQNYEEALRRMDPNDKRRAFATRRIGELDRRTPKLTVELSSNAARGAVVSLDGKDLSARALGTPQPLDPGEHRIELRAPGGRVERATIRLAEGEQRTIEIGSGSALVVERSSSKQPASQPTREHATAEQPASSGSSRTLGFVLGGIGAVGLAVAGVTGAMILDRRSTVKDECNDDKLCTAEGADAAESGRTLLIVNTVAWAVGVVGLGAGAYLVLSSDDGSPRARLVVRGAF